MRWSDIELFTTKARQKRALDAAVQVAAAVPETTHRAATRRHGGVTIVGVPSKIRRRMGKE